MISGKSALAIENELATPFWFGEQSRPLFGLVNLPKSTIKACALLCPPLGYESWTSYMTFRTLAETLCRNDIVAMRFDYDGSGNSFGDDLEPNRLQAWRDSIRSAVTELRSRFNHVEIVLIGLRFGASLAYEQAAGLGIKSVVLWDPIVNGRRYMRELKVLAQTSPDDDVSDGILEVSGCLYSPDTIQAVSGFDLLKLTGSAETSVLLLERDDRTHNANLLQHFNAQHDNIEHHAVANTALVMDVSTEDAQIPYNIVEQISSWANTRFVAAASMPVTTWNPNNHCRLQSTDIGVETIEELLRIPPLGLFSVLGKPADASCNRVVLFNTTGTEHRIGPGRAWVTLARRLNKLGIATLQLDFDGVGDSPLRGKPRRVRPYDPEFSTDVSECIAWLRQQGFTHITVMGLCAGAWIAVHAGMDASVESVIAINPQLYWNQGDPVESLLPQTRERRKHIRAQEIKGERYGIWTALDTCGIRPIASQWLDSLVRNKVRTLLAFSDNDDGLQYLQSRCGRRLAQVLKSGVISLVEVPGIDHPMHRHRKRPIMFEKIIQFILEIRGSKPA